jgi:predicted nucleotidyltransferase
MQEGISYPSARYEALKVVAEKQHAQVLKSPNDTLAVEYLKQMLLTNSSMQPMAIRRVHDMPEAEDSNLRPNTNSAMEPMAIRRLNDADLKDAAQWDSATRIRSLLEVGDVDEALSFMPGPAATFMREYVSSGGRFAFFSDIFALLTYAVRVSAPPALADILSATEGLENRLISAVHAAEDMAGLLRRTKTKRYTETRVKRLMIHTLLRLTKAVAAEADRATPYARVLAFSVRGSALLRKLSAADGGITLLSNPNRVKTLTEAQKLLLSLDDLAADLYHLITIGHIADHADLKKHPQ